MARPKKHELEVRSEGVRVRYTLPEIEHLQAEAQTAGLPMRTYVRQRSLGHRVVVPTFRGVDPSLIVQLNQCVMELKAWGNNINQIARNTNAGRRERLGWEDAQAETQRLIMQAEATLEQLVDSDGA